VTVGKFPVTGVRGGCERKGDEEIEEWGWENGVGGEGMRERGERAGNLDSEIGRSALAGAA